MLEAVFSAVVERPSAITQFYQVHPIIDVYDIEQAFVRFTQFFDTYNVLKRSVSVEIKTENGEFLRASSLEELKQYDQSQRSCVKSVDCEFSFLVRPGGFNKPANFKVDLNIREVPPLFRSSFLEVPEEVKSPIRLHIEFPDYVIARSLKLVVDDWIKTLKVIKPGKALLLAEAFAKKFNEVSAPIVGLFVSFGAYVWVRNEDLTNAEAIRICSFVFLLYFAIRVLNRFLGNSLVKVVSQYSVASGFKITEGDREKILEREKKMSVSRNGLHSLSL